MYIIYCQWFVIRRLQFKQRWTVVIPSLWDCDIMSLAQFKSYVFWFFGCERRRVRKNAEPCGFGWGVACGACWPRTFPQYQNQGENGERRRADVPWADSIISNQLLSTSHIESKVSVVKNSSGRSLILPDRDWACPDLYSRHPTDFRQNPLDHPWCILIHLNALSISSKLPWYLNCSIEYSRIT